MYNILVLTFQIVGEFEIRDRPAFTHRGFLLDTARNYFSVESIKRTIGKLSVFYFMLTESIHNSTFQMVWQWSNLTHSIGI